MPLPCGSESRSRTWGPRTLASRGILILTYWWPTETVPVWTDNMRLRFLRFFGGGAARVRDPSMQPVARGRLPRTGSLQSNTVDPRPVPAKPLGAIRDGHKRRYARRASAWFVLLEWAWSERGGMSLCPECERQASAGRCPKSPLGATRIGWVSGDDEAVSGFDVVRYGEEDRTTPGWSGQLGSGPPARTK